MDNNNPAPAPGARPRKGIDIFRFADANPLTEEQMPMEGIDDSVMAGFSKLIEAGGAESGGEKVLCLYREPEDDGLSLCYAWFKSGFVLPRHSHSADCLYYVIAGEVHLGKQVLCKGDGFFVPADAPYSYVAGPDGAEVLEFRNAARFNILFRNNDESHWEKMAQAFRDNGEKWKSEIVPPSDKSALTAQG
ncbi:hypothetical protein FV139_01035 [Parahaliea maris]|uniref:Cupin domain-containing protein n=1 Tax=Parahaliea maris TaxID=2716870 RepID=A0A5C9A962_9GAMM|nr:hypothetical protein [Parahaliea maris]TXS96117.1 hypothetical protein FV139_01035 [Parahaliea maris]